jgi:hypothetical protein
MKTAKQIFGYHMAEMELHREKATEAALQEIERLARRMLKKYKYMDEFLMAMGGYFVTRKPDKEILYDLQNKEWKELESFIDEYDDELKLTGDAMRFTAEGPKITDW